MVDGDVVARLRDVISRLGPLSDLPSRARRLLRPGVLRGTPGCIYWGLGVGLALAVLGLSRDTTQRSRGPVPTRTNPPLPPEYATLARHLADDHRTDPNQPDPKMDLPVILAELLGAASNLGGLKSADPDINALAARSHAGFTDAAGHLRRLDSLPKPPGFGEMFAESFARGFIGDIVGVVSSYREAQGRQDALADEMRSLVAAARRLEVDKLILPNIASRYAGPRFSGAPAVHVDLDGSWGPVGPYDWLTLANRAGSDLHNCTVLVELRDRSGNSAKDLHFVSHWPRGASIYARYSSGTELLGEITARQTVPSVGAVVVSLWADELSQESITHAYAGAERDEDVARYCKDMRVLASYRPFARGVLWDTGRGVHAQLRGMPFVAKTRVTIHFRRGDATVPLYWEFDRWDRDETKTLDTEGRLPWDPEGYQVVVTFPETAYSWRGNWSVK